jgi:hypothetical protein
MASSGGPGTASLKAAAAHMKSIVANSKLWREHGKGIKAMLNEWVGPLAIAIMLSGAFLKGLTKILRESELVRRSLEAFARVEYYTPSFARMLGGMSQARTRLNDLARMAALGHYTRPSPRAVASEVV